MFPFRGSERRAGRALHGAPAFPLFAEAARGVMRPCEVLRRPASRTGHVSTSPSSAGSRLSHGARRDPAASVGSADTFSFLVNPSRNGDKSHRYGTGTTACRTD